MINQEIINYIRTELANGVNREDLTNSLVKVGWGIKDVQDSFNAVFAQAPAPANYNPQSYELKTEKDYPITTLWVFKAPIIILVIGIIGLFFGVWFPYLVIAFPYFLIYNPLVRMNFHYSTEEKFFMVKEGIISKAQRNLPYGVIQNVFVKQDLFDRIFGLASLAVENASMGGKGFLGSGSGMQSFRLEGVGNQQEEGVGSSGNKVNIPGLKKEDAETFKNIILQRMKENPIEDSQSGL